MALGDLYVSDNMVFHSWAYLVSQMVKNPPSCPSADEWIRKLWYIYTMEYYSAIKKNTLKQF